MYGSYALACLLWLRQTQHESVEHLTHNRAVYERAQAAHQLRMRITQPPSEDDEDADDDDDDDAEFDDDTESDVDGEPCGGDLHVARGRRSGRGIPTLDDARGGRATSSGAPERLDGRRSRAT